MSKIQKNQMRKQNHGVLVKLTTCAMMAALSIIFCRMLGFPTSGVFRVEIGFLPIAIVAVLYGPFWAGISYGVADFVGALLLTGVNPFITLCKILFGVTMGFVFYGKQKIGIVRNILYFLFAGIVIDILLMTPIFIFAFNYEFAEAVVYRLIATGVNTPARIFALALTSKFILPSVYKYLGRKSDFATYANGFQAVPRLGLERITYLMKLLGDPQENLRCIHVAGTNGKGSTCAFMESILLAAGYKVGKYISPNLVRVNERITFCREEISDDDLNRLLAKIEAVIPDAERALGDKISQFEIWTAAMFCYFAEKNPDYVVLETGLGGEFDATNVISHNVMSVLTQIDIDHTEYLGDTIEKIAATKSKIIKKRCESGVVVVSDQDKTAIDVIEKEAKACGVKLIVPKREVCCERMEEIYEVISYGELRGLRLGLGGLYQIGNACTAIEAMLELGIDEFAIREGLAAAKNPARFEKIDEAPTVIYDGGHNPNGVRSLKASIDRYYPNTNRTVVFACMADKEFAPSLKMLDDGYSRFVFTTVQNNPRAMGAEALCDAAAEQGISGEWASDLKSAIALAREKGNLVVVCGSLYLYKDLT